jgi:hypothetical protein
VESLARQRVSSDEFVNIRKGWTLTHSRTLNRLQHAWNCAATVKPDRNRRILMAGWASPHWSCCWGIQIDKKPNDGQYIEVPSNVEMDALIVIP